MQPIGQAPLLRVLVVDPDDRTRQSLSGLLCIGSHCLVVGGAGGGDQALELAARLRPDVVVVDPRLPDADGARRFIGGLRALLPATRVLVMRRTDGPADGDGAIDADAFVRKTFRAHELVDAVLAAGRLERTVRDDSAPSSGASAR